MKRLLGFSIVEILVVISIIGTLATFTYVSFDKARTASRDATRKKDLTTLKTALTSYRIDHGNYPSKISDLTSNYINQLPKDPLKNISPASPVCDSLTDYQYCYSPSASNQTFIVWAKLENANDSETIGKPDSKCSQATAPSGSSFNYCIESPN